MTTQLASFSPPLDVVVFVGYSPEAMYLAKQLRQTDGLSAALVCTDGVYGRRFVGSAAADGTHVVYQVQPNSELDKRPRWTSYAKAFERRYRGTRPEGWAVWAYDGLGILSEATKLSLQITRVPRSGVLHSVLNREYDRLPFYYKGALSDYEFDSRENKFGRYFVYTVKDDRYVPFAGDTPQGDSGEPE